MSVPELPLLMNVSERSETDYNVDLIYSWLNDFSANFANAAGFAIDSTQGEGGDGSLTIQDVPGGITYNPGSGLSVDSTLFGHIDITFTLPTRAIDVVIRYREVGVTAFKSSTAHSSPYRLPNLKVGVDYELQIAGEAANGAEGPYSPLTHVVIPTTSVVIKALADEFYWVGQLSNDLSNEIVPSGEVTVMSVNPLTGLISVEVNGITYNKIQQVTASRLLGRGSSGIGDVEEITIGTGLTLSGTTLNGTTLGSPDTGWSVTNETTDKILDADLTSLDEIADVLGSVIEVLITKGILSA